MEGQPQGDPGPDPSAHGLKLHEYLGYEGQLFGTQHVVNYEEEARFGGARSHRASTYDHTGAVGTWTRSALPARQALRQPAPLS